MLQYPALVGARVATDNAALTTVVLYTCKRTALRVNASQSYASSAAIRDPSHSHAILVNVPDLNPATQTGIRLTTYPGGMEG